jgi:peptidyl-prolyl cis-trans isomerase C
MYQNIRNIFLYGALVLTVSVCAAGCGRMGEKTPDESGVVAKINNYELTIADFKDEADLTMANKYLSEDPGSAKEEFLEDLITKKLLILEAQKLNFDKEKTFLKMIERYWEQSLIKLLLKKKSLELAGKIRVEEHEVIEEYKRMKLKVFADLIVLKDRQSADKLSKSGADFEAEKAKINGDGKIEREQSDWWVIGDLPQYLEDALFSLKAGGISPAIKTGNSWMVIEMVKSEERPMEPFDKMSGAIRQAILEKKKEAALEKWSQELRKRASVRIYKKTLEKINIGGKK